MMVAAALRGAGIAPPSANTFPVGAGLLSPRSGQNATYGSRERRLIEKVCCMCLAAISQKTFA